MSWNGSNLSHKQGTAQSAQGASQQPTTDKQPTAKRSALRGALAGGIVVAVGLAVLGYFFFLRATSVDKRSAKDVSTRSSVVKPNKSKLLDTKIQLPVATNSVVTPCEKSVEVADDSQMDEGSTTNNVVNTNVVDGAKKDARLFKNPMDQILAMVAPHKVGESVPPLPIANDMQFSEEDERKILERLTADDKDSDQVIERKEIVQSMRDEYQELKKRGWSFIDYVKALEAKANLDTEVLEESEKIHETVFNDTTVTDAEYLKTLEKINKVLADRGIDPIQVPTDDEETENKNKDFINQSQKGK